ncbi:dermonecrotic toxin domain-containing protein [Pseudomonas yamanorum]
MSQTPYFFPEAMRVGWRALDRERQLNIDSKDIEFLGKVFFASDAGRRQQSPPMIAQRIWLNKGAADAVELAGSFMMSSTSAYPHAWLYTPYGGLEKFDSPALVLTALKERLKKPADATQLLCFLPLMQQASQVLDDSLVLTPEFMVDDVFGEQENTLRHYQGKNRQALLAELKQLPALGSLLSKLLESICRPLFPGLDAGQAHVSFFARQPAGDALPRWLDSLQINDAVLLFYREQAWPAGQTREFFHPKQPADAKDPERKARDTQRWESAIKQAAGQLIPFLHSALETFWNTEVSPGVSRRAWFAQAMAANARLDLLLKRQQSIISPEQGQALAVLYESEGKEALRNSHVLRFEKVLVWEHSTNVVELASTLMIGNSQTFLYTPDKGLQVLGSYDDLMEALRAMVKAPGYEDDLYNLMSLEERALFIGFKVPQFSGKPIAGNLFEHLFEAIIGKQQQNLRYALDLYRRTRAGIEPSALVDHALDVRYMVDSHLPSLDTAGRWTPHSVLADPTRPVSLAAERASLLQKQLLGIRDTLAAQIRAQPTLENTVNQALISEFSRRGLAGRDPGRIYINRYTGTASAKPATAPLESQSLRSYFLARLIHGREPIPQTPDYGLYDGAGSGVAKKLTVLDIPQANAILEATLIKFHNYNITDIPREHLEQLKAPMAHAMAVAIRGEAGLRRLNNSLDARDEAIVQTVFDLQHPDRRQRQGLGGFIPDAYALTVEPQGLTQRVPLAHCLMLTERGGLDPSHSGRAVLWTPARGLESFANVSQLQTELKRRLAAPALRMQLLANLDPHYLKPHQPCPLGHFMQINGAVAQHRQQSWIDHYKAQRAHCLTLKLSGDALLKRLEELEKALPANDLDHASQIAQTLMAQQSLPAWLGMAAVSQQRRHVEILEQYRHNLDGNKDYLDGFVPLSQYLKGKLEELLEDYDVLPQDVYILPKLVLAGQRQNLVDYALNHISQQAAEFDVESTATGLTPTIVRQILARLPLKQDNKAYLAEKLTPGKPGAEAREQRFIRQLPWQLLQNAHALKLQELLSPTGLSLIEQVLDMPDAIARAAVKDATSTLRPLELIATAGARTIKALGVYVFNTIEKAPLVMYAPYGPQQAFQEFENEADLIRKLNLPGPLQDWVVGRLPAAEQATYKNLWTSTFGKTSEITLASNPIKGHALKQLYRDNIELISSLFEQQTQANGRSAWDTLKALFTHGLQQAQALLPGKLMVPLVIWQSYKLFKTSAEDLQQHRWRDALETFIGGVAQMASMRELMDEPATASTATQPVLTQTASAWHDIDVTAQARTRLQAYEACDISLESLKVGNSGVYTSTDNRHYLPYAGKVYRAKQAEGHWRLFSARSKGPFVRLDSERKWVLDPGASVRRHGPGWSAMMERRGVRSEVDRVMNVEARGLAEIRRVAPHRAQAIVEALDLATFYLHNCHQNLKLLDHKYPPVTRIHRFINRFFGIPINPDTGPPTFPEALSQKLMDTVTAILDEVLEPSLYSLNSRRFVSGVHLAEPERHWAFTIDDDPDRRIYLTENFFNPPTADFEGRLINYFDQRTHARATTLIHELTHIVSNTADAAYLNSVSPFADLIEVETPAGRDLQKRLRDLQENGYSVSTPMGQLFKSTSPSGAAGTDIGTEPEDDYIKQQILTTTGGVDLSNARGIFKTNLTQRFNTQMDNADSLTLLITTLGRQLDAVPSIAEGTP